MVYLNDLSDEALWQAARSTMAYEQKQRLQTLHDLKQRRGLTSPEQTEDEALLALYRDTLLVRAQAANLLQQRGYDVSDPEQFTPLA